MNLPAYRLPEPETEFVWENAAGWLDIEALPDSRYELRGRAKDLSVHVPHSPCVTDYPLSLIRLIFDAFGPVFTCDEISRDIDASEASLDVQHSVQAYFQDTIFNRSALILDYGCGGGSSSVALAKLFPQAKIVGVDFAGGLLEIAKGRAGHHGMSNLRFEAVPASGRQFDAEYDFVFLNAVYEHLLPAERPAVMAGVWSALKTDGILFLNQTPHRWFPIEAHTSGLPLINYLPKSPALWAMRKFCKRSIAKASWTEMLRAGIRGATVGEIMRNIQRIDPHAARVQPIRLATSWAGIWYATKRARLNKVSGMAQRLIKATQSFVQLSRLPLSPYISIAVKKLS